jgi:hypothetical protein
VDAAGNASVPSSFSFKPFSLAVANPVPGKWANQQRLVVASEGAAEVFWSDDGSDPFGPTGKPYRGAVLISRTGSVLLKVAAKSPDGRVERREVSFEVSGDDAAPLAELRELESDPILSERPAAVPDGFRWDIGTEAEHSSASELAFAGGTAAVLRPVEGIGRLVPFYASDGASLHRFLFSLGADKTESTPPAAVPAAPSGIIAPVVYSAGRARAALWDRKNGLVRYRWNGSVDWTDASMPVSVSAEGGSLEWIVERGSSVDGPFSVVFPATAAEASFPSSVPRASAANASVSSGPVVLSPPENAEGVRFTLSASSAGLDPRTVELSRGVSVKLDVCDGEQFSWTAYGDGSSLVLRIDRRSPSPPRLSAPEEGGWVHDAPTISFVADEGRVDALVRWRDESGRSDSFALPVSSVLRSSGRGIVEYEIEARTVDIAGNPSESIIRKFTVDEATVYVSGAAAFRPGDGSRTNPFNNLNDALVAAASGGRSRIWVSGAVSARADIPLFDGLTVEGGFDSRWRRGGNAAVLLLAPGTSFFIDRGTSRLSALRLVESSERRRPLVNVIGSTLELTGFSVLPLIPSRADFPVLSLRSGAKLNAKDCIFSGGSPAIDSASSDISLAECLVSASGGRDGRQSAIRAIDSMLRLHSSRVETGVASGDAHPGYSTAVDGRGGKLALSRSVLTATASNSAVGLNAKDLSLESSDSDVSATAGEYASALSADGGSASLSGGSLSAEGRDAAAVVLGNLRTGAFNSVRFSISGNGVVRAVQVRGAFPSISSCRFEADAGSSGAEALAGDPPSDGSLRDNRFSGFSYLYDRSYPAASLSAFNKSFAGSGPPNSILSDGK